MVQGELLFTTLLFTRPQKDNFEVSPAEIPVHDGSRPFYSSTVRPSIFGPIMLNGY